MYAKKRGTKEEVTFVYKRKECKLKKLASYLGNWCNKLEKFGSKKWRKYQDIEINCKKGQMRKSTLKPKFSILHIKNDLIQTI